MCVCVYVCVCASVTPTGDRLQNKCSNYRWNIIVMSSGFMEVPLEDSDEYKK